MGRKVARDSLAYADGVCAQRDALKAELAELKVLHASLVAQVDSLHCQLGKLRSVNHLNAAAHRASEVAALRQNHELQRYKALAEGRKPHPELGPVPAMAVPVINQQTTPLIASQNPNQEEQK